MAERWWYVGGRAFTLVYWGCVAIFAGAVVHVRTLPFVDYPQHIALAATLRRLLLGDPAARALFETNLASYNSLFHLLAACLPLPIELSARVVLAGTLVLFASACLALLRALDRPAERALVVLAVLGGYPLAWGFVNYVLGAGVALFVAARVLSVRALPSLRREAITALLALVAVYAHLFAAAFVDLLIVVALVARAHHDDDLLPPRALRAARRVLPLLPAALYAIFVFVAQSSSPHRNFEYASSEGSDVYALEKVRDFFVYATGLRADGHDARILMAAVALCALALVTRRKDGRAPPEARAILLSTALAYLVVPHTLWATNFVFERVTIFVVVALALATPRAGPRIERVVTSGLVVVAVASAVGFATTLERTRDVTRDLDAVLDAAPPGRRLLTLLSPREIPGLSQPALLHAGEWYVARKGGECAGSFARITSLPVHYQVGRAPPALPAEFEWRPEEYWSDAPYAKYFDLVLVHETEDLDPRRELWGIRGETMTVLAHGGGFWLVETR